MENISSFGAHKDLTDEINCAYSKYTLIIFICSKWQTMLSMLESLKDFP